MIGIIRIQGLSIDEEFNKILNDHNNEYMIHSIFDKVINIKSINGEIYTIANEFTDNAPYTLKTDFNNSFKDFIDNDSKISIDKERIIFDNLEIRLSNTIIWNSRKTEISDKHSKNIKSNIEIYNRLIRSSGKEGGCKYSYLKYFLNLDITGNLIEKELGYRIISLYENLKLDNFETEAINKIIGFGMGLTPSGDDFLTGFLGVISMNESTKDVFDRFKESIVTRLSLTTEVSSSMLKAATKEKFREILNDFILSFLQDNNKFFENKLEKLLDIGSSSGTDISVGVVLGFLYLIHKSEW
ncbi:MAG: DUF2877 domain-containing protein [Ignavibacteria bacterium]|nr:DUF2877 domain-containing protein [Ignavibacteria bacterium]